MNITEYSLQSADEVIARIKQANGVDYSSKREELTATFKSLLHGNWTAHTDFDDLPNLYFIQEDEYDQSMEYDDDKPEHDTMICYAANHYIFPD